MLSPDVYLRCSENSTENPWNGLACSPAMKPSTMNLARRSSRATWRITSGFRYFSAVPAMVAPSELGNRGKWTFDRAACDWPRLGSFRVLRKRRPIGLSRRSGSFYPNFQQWVRSACFETTGAGLDATLARPGFVRAVRGGRATSLGSFGRSGWQRTAVLFQKSGLFYPFLPILASFSRFATAEVGFVRAFDPRGPQGSGSFGAVLHSTVAEFPDTAHAMPPCPIPFGSASHSTPFSNRFRTPIAARKPRHP